MSRYPGVVCWFHKVEALHELVMEESFVQKHEPLTEPEPLRTRERASRRQLAAPHIIMSNLRDKKRVVYMFIVSLLPVAFAAPNSSAVLDFVLALLLFTFAPSERMLHIHPICSPIFLI